MSQARPPIVAIGGSAGAIEPLQEVMAKLPADLAAAVFVVIHVPALATSHLDSILGRAGVLPVEVAVDGAAIAGGRVVVAPPDHHLLLQRTRIALRHGPKENGNRPAIDPLFRSASMFGNRAMGVVLSGLLDDGSAGLSTIRRRGGVCVVQDPADAAFSAMPQNAIARAEPQHVAGARGIADLIVEFASAGGGDYDEGSRRTSMADDPADARTAPGAADRSGTPTGYACPECHGVLWVDADDGMSFVCRVGHRMSAESLAELHTNHVDSALWAAYRALEEQASLCETLAARMADRGSQRTAARFSERGADARQQAEIMRRSVLELPDVRDEEAAV